MADELLAMEFPPPRYAVPGLVTEGLNLLVGAPKLGKSWLALGLCCAVAAGGHALGRIEVDRGRALLLALEDPPRRLQERLRALLDGDDPPRGLRLETAWPRIDQGGAEQLHAYLDKYPDFRLVVIDVFAKVRRRAPTRQSQYDTDYSDVAELKAIADEHSLAVLVLHHDRKQEAKDWLDTVSGTHGIAGAADTILALARARSSADAELHITGRDVPEATHALHFDGTTGSWALDQHAASELRLSPTRRTILDHLRATTRPLTPREVSDATGLGYENVKKTLARMAEDGQTTTTGDGTYAVPTTPDPDGDLLAGDHTT